MKRRRSFIRTRKWIPAFAGMTAKIRTRAAQALSSKSNSPYPPCQGGKKKQNPFNPVGGASPFYTPLTRGGRGGVLFYAEGGVRGLFRLRKSLTPQPKNYIYSLPVV